MEARPRIDKVVANLREYADRFVELPLDLVAVLVTHMDSAELEWTREEFLPLIEEELGSCGVVFSE